MPNSASRAAISHAYRIPASRRLIDIGAVLAITTLSRATLYRRVRAADFPRPLHIAPRRVAWIEQDVADWISERKGVTGQAA